MSVIDSRQALADYALRKLGEPVIEINIDDDQIEDCIDDALQFYQEYHSDAVTKAFYRHQITESDVTNKYITLPSALVSIARVFPIKKTHTGDDRLFDASFMMERDMIYNMTNASGYNTTLVDYEMNRQYRALVTLTIDGNSQQVTFSRHMSRLTIEVDWDTHLAVDDFIIIECYMIIDPEEVTSIYNDRMLKKYLVALMKKAWSTNLVKYEGMQLPGGTTISGRAMYEDAISEIDKIETDFQMKYSFPPEMQVG